MQYIEGDLLDIKAGIICHQVNCQLKMGAGLARQIRNKWPVVYSEYIRVMSQAPAKDRLGICQMVEITPKTLYVANLFGQFHYLPRGTRHTDYNALAVALRSLSKWRQTFFSGAFPVFVPELMGCGLAGGDIKEVHAIIRGTLPNAIIVRYKK